MPRRTLFGSFLVANFFNNFLPSNIGGDVIRIRDTAPAAQSTTLATTVVLVDRGLGLMGLVLIAAIGATMAVGLHGQGVLADLAVVALARFLRQRGRAPSRRCTRPMRSAACCSRSRSLHPEWVGKQIDERHRDARPLPREARRRSSAASAARSSCRG